MIFRGHHGVSEAERSLVQRFRVDVALELDLRPAARSDDLGQACDYSRVFETVQHLVENRTFQLLETLAERIAEAILEGFPAVSALTVGVFKPDPPIHGTFERVGVEICRARA